MDSTDLMTILGNVSHSLLPVQTLITGLGYMLGLLFMYTALTKLKSISGSKSGSHEKMSGVLGYFLGSVALIFLPTMISILSNSTFGSTSVLQYGSYSNYNIYGSMGVVLQTAGLIWFVRGCVLLVHGSTPGVKHGTKGLIFLIAGIFAVNFKGTLAGINYAVTHLIQLTSSPF